MRGALAPLLVGLCCVVVLGAAGGAMDGAVETDPAEVINTELLSLPYQDVASSAGEDVRSALEEGFESGSQDGDHSPDAGPSEPEPESEAGQDETATSPEEQSEQDPGREEAETSPDEESELDAEQDGMDHSADAESEPDADQEDAETSPDAEPDGSSDPEDEDTSDQDDTQEEDDPSFLEQLLDWLQGIFASIRALLPVLLAFVGIGLILTQRGRLQQFLGTTELHEEPSIEESAPNPSVSPSDPVERAWLEMLDSCELHPDTHRSLTSREWAEAAIDAGADREAVERLTCCLEETRFTEGPPTGEIIERATTARDQIRQNE